MIWDWHYWVMLDLFLSGTIALFGVAKRRVTPDWWEFFTWPLVVPYVVLLVIADAVRWVVRWRRERIAEG